MRIAVVTNAVPGWSPKDPEGWGGGEEMVVGIARAFARRGHEVTVFTSMAETLCDADVWYMPHSALPSYVGKFDFTLHHKSPDGDVTQFALAPVRALWTDQERPFNADPFDWVVSPSPYLARYLRALMPRTEGKVEVIPYAYDPEEIPAAGDIVRNANLVVHASSPDRGLTDLLALWPRIREQTPEVELRIAYGWELFDKYGGDPRLKAQILRQVESLGRVTMKRYTRAELARLYREAGVWAFWCTGGEQFCITAVKAQVSGCIPVVKPWGALHDTVWSGRKVETRDEFVGAMTEMLSPDEQGRQRNEQYLRNASYFLCKTFDEVATQWEQLIARTVLTGERQVPQTHVVPSTPQLKPEPLQSALGVVHQAVAQWVAHVQPKRIYVDPAFGFPGGESAVMADAAVLGWSIEDAATSPAATIKKLGLKDGIPVLWASSFGPWRTTRERVLHRRDLAEILGQQGGVQMRAVPLDTNGSGIILTSFTLKSHALMDRNLTRARAQVAPRQTLSACLMVRDAAGYIVETLERLLPIMDELCVVDTGSVDDTVAVVEAFALVHGVQLKLKRGKSPRWCFDCLREHELGEMGFGHRVAGFEYARNESIALATSDWCMWVDADEKLCNAEGLAKYLQPNIFEGYSIPQHHHSVDPPEAGKVDMPVRLFRRREDPEQGAGEFLYGDLRWPTFHSGLTVRFAGIVHEHPGVAPNYGEGMAPVIVLSDIHLAHSGYYTEEGRRGRFVRNWPLMAADRQKYPERRLGRFLEIRDLIHHLRYTVEKHGNQIVPEAVQYAEDALALWRDNFAGSSDPFVADALGYVSVAGQMLGRGVDVTVNIAARKPEITGEETLQIAFAGRVENAEQLVTMLTHRLKDWERWEGEYL